MSMSKVRDRIAVRCPIAETQSRLESYFAERRGADGVTRLPLRGIAGLEGLALGHDVAVVAQRARDDQNLNDLIRVSWKPEGGGPYPTFSGTLLAWAEHDPRHSFVELEGNYAPPLGVAGEVFDEALGHAIAHRTAHMLLRDIADAIASHAGAKTT